MNDFLTRFYKIQDQDTGSFSVATAGLEGDTIVFRMGRGCSYVMMVIITLVTVTLGVMVGFAFVDLPRPLGVGLIFLFALWAAVCVSGFLGLIRRNPYFGIDTASSEIVVYDADNDSMEFGHRPTPRRFAIDNIVLFAGVSFSHGDGTSSFIYCIDSDRSIHKITSGVDPISSPLFISGYVCNKLTLEVLYPPEDVFTNRRLPKDKSISDIISMGKVVFDPEKGSDPGK